MDDSSEGVRMAVRKQQIKNIIKSYIAATDVLAEPVQNAVDEVARAKTSGLQDADHVTVAINVQQNTIEVRDNGRGLSPEDAKRFLGPNSTDKADDFLSGLCRGHKGVGLTFLAYGFNDFELESRSQSGDHYRISLKGGRAWVEGKETTAPLATIDFSPSNGRLAGRGTRVMVRVDKQSTPRDLSKSFNNGPLSVALVESHTAIGVVPPVTQVHPEFTANLEYTSSAGMSKSHPLATSLRLPHQHLPKEIRTLDLGDYLASHVDDAEPDAKDKRAYYACYRTFSTADVASHANSENTEQFEAEEDLIEYIKARRVTVYGLFSYSSHFRDVIRDAWSVAGNKKFYHAGVRVATDGMISTWGREVSLRGASGNKERLWLVYHFYDVEPDMGRKTFPPEIDDILRATESSLANDLMRKSQPFLKPTPKAREESEDLVVDPAVKAHERRSEGLEFGENKFFGKIPYGSTPDDEMDVIALFNMLVGKGALAHLSPVYFSGWEDYDSYFDVNPKVVSSAVKGALPGDPHLKAKDLRGIAEFKLRGDAVLQDVVNLTKEWSEMKFLVCWTVGNTKKALGGDEIQFTSCTSSTERRYDGFTHLATLQSAGSSVLHVLALRDFLEVLAS